MSDSERGREKERKGRENRKVCEGVGEYLRGKKEKKKTMRPCATFLFGIDKVSLLTVSDRLPDRLADRFLDRL